MVMFIYFTNLFLIDKASDVLMSLYLSVHVLFELQLHHLRINIPFIGHFEIDFRMCGLAYIHIRLVGYRIIMYS